MRTRRCPPPRLRLDPDIIAKPRRYCPAALERPLPRSRPHPALVSPSSDYSALRLFRRRQDPGCSRADWRRLNSAASPKWVHGDNSDYAKGCGNAIRRGSGCRRREGRPVDNARCIGSGIRQRVDCRYPGIKLGEIPLCAQRLQPAGPDRLGQGPPRSTMTRSLARVDEEHVTIRTKIGNMSGPEA